MHEQLAGVPMPARQLILPAPMSAARQTYDHRLRLAIAETGNPHLFPEAHIPESTRRTWTRRAVPNVVALRPEDSELVDLHVAVASLEAF